MSTREVQEASATTFAYGRLDVSADEPWSVKEGGAQPCVHILPQDTVVRVAPMARQGWTNVHFSPQLRLPLESPRGDGIVVTLEAMARECVAVALSPDSSFQLGKTYVVHFGAAGNTSTVIRRRLATGTEAVDVTFPSRVCQERAWVPYWIALLPTGKLYVGTGKLIGKHCIGCLDDSLYHQLRPGQDAVKYVGLGNSALTRNARPLKMRNVCVTSVPTYLRALLQSLPTDNYNFPYQVAVTSLEDDSEETKAMMEEYQKECQKNRARSLKFGIPYKEPQNFLQWSQARRLRANPEKGFITGMDIYTAEELAKQEARKARFGLYPKNKRKGLEQGQDDDDEEEEEEEEEAMEEDIEAIPIIQAWDNEPLVRHHRTDPPVSLYVNPPPSEERREETEEFSMEDGSSGDAVTLVPEKIHICSIDWAAFTQIRTDDIMAYFKEYGPSYIEWLAELSCNVLFEDKFSAARALHHMSQEIPSPPPPEVEQQPTNEEGPPDFGNMGWRFCQQPIRKVNNDRYGRRGTTARILMRVANSADVLVKRPKSTNKKPPGFSTKKVLGPGSDYYGAEPEKKRRRMDLDRNNNNMGVFDPNSGAEHPGLSRGLKSGREGFSVDDLRVERARKIELESVAESHSEQS